MRILFINSNQFKQPWPVIPIGILTTAAHTKEYGHLVQVLDICFVKKPEKKIRKTINNFKPDIIGIGIRNIDNSGGDHNIFLLEKVKMNIINPIKKHFTGPVIIGGTAVGISAHEILDYLSLEYAIRGDGEKSIHLFSLFLEKTIDGEQVEGLVHRKNKINIINNPPSQFNDFRCSSIYPYDLIDLTLYKQFNSPLQIQTKRGCPFTCSYCTYNQIEGNIYRLKSPEIIVEEITKYTKKTGINYIEFTDSTFNLPLDHIKKILTLLSKKNLNLALRTMGLNPLAVDEELIQLMKKNNFHEVDLGVESMCDETLLGFSKNYTTKHIVNAVNLLHKHNIPISFYLLLGAPNETKQTIMKTLNNINEIALPTDLINIGVGVRIYNGSPMSRLESLKNEKENSNNFFFPKVYNPEGISVKEIKVHTRQMAFMKTNYFLFDEDENTPSFVLKSIVIIFNLFFKNTPLWYALIFRNKLLKYLGVRIVMKYIHYLKNYRYFCN